MLTKISIAMAFSWLVMVGALSNEQDDNLRIVLSKTEAATLPWGATEWTVSFHNTFSEDMPFGPYLLTADGIGGVRMSFEVERSGEKVREWASNPNIRGGRKVSAGDDLLTIGESEELLAILHGRMEPTVIDGDSGPEAVMRFVPTFPEAGTYSVNVLLKWGTDKEYRSNVCKVIVSQPKLNDVKALEKLKVLASEGTCLELQGLGRRGKSSQLIALAKFVELEAGTFYAGQMRIKLARAYLGDVHDLIRRFGPNAEETLDRIARVKNLLSTDFLIGHGLTKSLERLRSAKALNRKQKKTKPLEVH